MKTLSIVAFNAFTRENGTEMFAIRTSQGVVYATKNYLERKAKSIGKTVSDILSNAKQFEINAEEVVERQKGVEFTYIDKEDVEQTSTPNSDYLEVRSFDLALTQSGSLNQMIASSVADRIADSLAGAFSGLGMPSVNQNISSDNDDSNETEEEIVIEDETAIENAK